MRRFLVILCLAALAAGVVSASGPAAGQGGRPLRGTLTDQGSCNILLTIDWPSPKTGQSYYSVLLHDVTTGHAIPFSDIPLTADQTEAFASFYPSVGGPDHFFGEATLYDSSGNALASTSTRRYSFACTV